MHLYLFYCLSWFWCYRGMQSSPIIMVPRQKADWKPPWNESPFSLERWNLYFCKSHFLKAHTCSWVSNPQTVLILRFSAFNSIFFFFLQIWLMDKTLDNFILKITSIYAYMCVHVYKMLFSFTEKLVNILVINETEI